MKKAEDVEKLANIKFIDQWYLFDTYKKQNNISRKRKIILSTILRYLIRLTVKLHFINSIKSFL